MKTITSRRTPLVARYRAAARGEPSSVALLDGAHLVVEALNAGLRIREAAVTPDAGARRDIAPVLERLAGANADVIFVAASVMDALSPVKSSSGIVALADRPDPAGYRMYEGTNPLVVLAIDVQDPGNIGAMVRVAEAAGATGLVAAGVAADPFGWRAMRGSMGSSMRLPIALERDAGTAIADARDRGCRIMATVPRDGRSMFEVDYTGSMAILIGGEGSGLPAALIDDADERVMVPMKTPVESLNVAVTAALIVYEAFRQRTGTGAS